MKILPTIGPATANITSIRKISKFTNLLRLNGSHNTINWHKKTSSLIKKNIANAVLLIDIPGIKPRTANTDIIHIKKNEKFIIYFTKKPNNYKYFKKIPITKPLPKIKKLKKCSMSDGQYIFDVLKIKHNYCLIKSKQNFQLKPFKGINLPNAVYDDKIQLREYKKFLNKINNINYDAVGLSFIQSSKLIKNLRKQFPEKLFVSKIENHEGLKNYEEIIKESDIIMIDRGDLAAEIGNEKLYNAIYSITKCTKKYGKSLIVATENLDSMIERFSPTKSEVTSISSDFFLGTDVIMLSDETATSDNWHNTLSWLNAFINNLKKIDTFVEDKSEININNSTFENISIWNSFNFNKIRKTNFVFFSRSGSSIYQFQKFNTKNTSFVFTDSKKTKSLCQFWKNVICFYVKDLRGFNSSMQVLKIINKYRYEIFSKNIYKIVCIYITNPRKGSRANTIYIVDKKDLKTI